MTKSWRSNSGIRYPIANKYIKTLIFLLIREMKIYSSGVHKASEMFVRDEGREHIPSPVWRKEKGRIIPKAFRFHKFLPEQSAI